MASVRSRDDAAQECSRPAMRSGIRVQRRSRPLTAAQERLFFVVLLAVAVLLQVGAVWMPSIVAN